jgi:hypothetical protein
MTVNVTNLLQFFFWIKLAPVRKIREPENTDSSHDNKEIPINNYHDSVPDTDPKICDIPGINEDHVEMYYYRRQKNNTSPDWWEWDFTSLKFWLLMLIMMAAESSYIYFAINGFTHSPGDLFAITILIYKLLNMTPSITVPWTLGPAAIKLGQLALPPKLDISCQDLASWLLAPFGVSVGLALIHVHSVYKQPWGALPVGFLSAFNCIAYVGQVCFLFAWLHHFNQRAMKVGQQDTIMAKEADCVLQHFEQLKAASSNILFAMLVIWQVIQIFSLFNILTCKYGGLIKYKMKYHQKCGFSTSSNRRLM